jgi:hypothetical protein
MSGSNTLPTSAINDGDSSKKNTSNLNTSCIGKDMYLVVGYRDHYSSTSKEMYLYGLYNSSWAAKQRILKLTGKETDNLCRGNNYCCWINKINMGEIYKTPNAGAYDIF